MAGEIAVFNEQTARYVIEQVRQIPRLLSRIAQLETTLAGAPIKFTNDSGETIPAYACMQITGTEEQGGVNYLVADKPADTDGTSGWYLFNGAREVETDGEGVAQSPPVMRGYKNTGTITGGERWAPTSGQWYLTRDNAGIFIAAGADNVDDDVLRVMEIGGSGGRLYRFTMNENWGATTAGAADSDILEMDGTDTTIDDDVLDPLSIFSSLTSGSSGICVHQDGKYYAIQAPCP